MPHWLLKSGIQRFIAALPASHRWNEVFQKHFTRSLDFPACRFEDRLSFCKRHLEYFRQQRPRAADGWTVIEIGTGWYPVVPLGLYLSGAGSIWTYDLFPTLSVGRVADLLGRFVGYHRDGRLEAFLPGYRRDRLTRLEELLTMRAPNPCAMLERIGINARVGNAQESRLPDCSIDFFTSTGVLQYIPRDILKQVLAEFKRLSTPSAVHIHYMDLADQFSYFDNKITPLNFLQYSSRSWKYLGSPLTWANRLRLPDYLEIFAETGYRILQENRSSGSPELLRQIKLAPEFRKYAPEELLVLKLWLVSELAERQHVKTAADAEAGRRVDSPVAAQRDS